jgi:PAS domain S-box-containing protein
MIRSMVGTTGFNSLQKITENISSWLGAECVMVGEIQPDRQTVKVLSMLLDGKNIPDFTYSLKGTPCDNVAEKGFCIYPDNVTGLFPGDKDLVDLNIRGYIGTPLRNSQGFVVGILCALFRNPVKAFPAVQEIMNIIAVKAAAEIERKRAEEALRESENRFRKIFENSPLGMTLVTPDFHFFAANPGWTAMTGYSEEELRKLTFKDITHPDHLAGDIEHIQEIVAGKIPFYATEKRYIRKDGSIVWGLINVIPIHDNPNSAGLTPTVSQYLGKDCRGQCLSWSSQVPG